MLIAIAVRTTDENKRFDLTKKCLKALVEFTFLDNKDRIVIIDNASSQTTKEFLQGYQRAWPSFVTLITNPENYGTAHAINQAISLREQYEIVCKMDDDVLIYAEDWIRQIERVFTYDPQVGICGLKRKDLEQRPGHTVKEWKTNLSFLPRQKGQPWIVVEDSAEVMGTCEAFNPTMLNVLGYLWQPSVYGFDDMDISLRSKLAGFRNVFLPTIEIDHIDPGGTDYILWKQLEASRLHEEWARTKEAYELGRLPLRREFKPKGVA